MLYLYFDTQNPGAGVTSAIVDQTTTGKCEFPSIDIDNFGIPLLAYAKEEEIYYTKSTPFGWTTPENLSQSTGIESNQPFIEFYRGRIVVLWEEDDPEDIYMRYSWSSLPQEWSDKENISSSTGRSTYPVIEQNGNIVWSENDNGNWEIFYRWGFPGGGWSQIRNLSNTVSSSKYPHMGYSRFPEFSYLYACWTEGDEPYEVRFDEFEAEPSPLYVSGHITENSVWEQNVFVTGDIVIDSGVTLTIEPGNRV